MGRSIADMVVIITGASAGIGKALAQELSRCGARLVLAARRVELLDELNASLGGTHLCVRTDVGDDQQCADLIEKTVARFGRIDTLVCNAGYGLIRHIARMSDADLRRIFEVNVLGTTHCIRHAAPIMLSQEPRDGYRGQIMIVSSAAARRGLPYFGAYTATKAAQLSIAEAMRLELGPRQIAVTSVHPMQTDTEFFSAAEASSGRKLPIRRQGKRGLASVQGVARKMARGIERPVRELWPMPCSRTLMLLTATFPGLADWGIRRALG